MATGLISVGVPTTITQNIVYALPTKQVLVNSSLAVQVSLDGTTWTNLTGAETSGAVTGQTFIRCTVGNALVNCTPATGSSLGSIGGINKQVQFNDAGIPAGDTEFIYDKSANALSIGANPAQSGTLRLPNNQVIYARNAANNADIKVIGSDGSNNIIMGDNVNTTTRAYVDGYGGVFLRNSGAQYLFDVSAIYAQTDGNKDIGHQSFKFRNVICSGALQTGVKVGAPVDADVTNPTDGMIRIDSANSKIWVRIGGVWKGALLS